MSSLLEKALAKVVALPPDEQDAIASQILASLAGNEAWKKCFAEKRDALRRMAREALRLRPPSLTTGETPKDVAVLVTHPSRVSLLSPQSLSHNHERLIPARTLFCACANKPCPETLCPPESKSRSLFMPPPISRWLAANY